ncbi:MAG: zinc ABC transporter substrate-binding protein, partial [Thermoplasmata archaeon]|nr:zinc ABC transporter substrate-binding protein [Thermoplasmata archaeon]
MPKTPKTVAVAIALAFVIGGVGYMAITSTAPPVPADSGVIPVVAAENFWGSLIAQLGGVHVSVTSIVTDPNADPHEYEANASDARAISNAQLVIENGEGYDDWFTQLVASAGSPGQESLNVQDLLGVASGANPHFWYNPSYVNITVSAMYSDLVSIAPADTSYFQGQYATLNVSLGALYGEAQ